MAKVESFSEADAMKALENVSEYAPPALDPNDREGPMDDEDEEQESAASDVDEVDDDAAAQDESEVDASATDDEEDDAGPQEETTDEVDEAEDKDEPAEKQIIEPPQYMDDAQKAEFKKLPVKAQEFVAAQATRLQSDYSRKTGELAVQRKSLDNRLKALAGVRTELEKRCERWRNWDSRKAAATMDPKIYQQNLAERDADFNALRNVRARAEREEAQDWNDHVGRERKALETDFKFLHGQENKAKREEVMNAVLAAGVTEERARWITAQEMAFVWKALQWDKYQAERKKAPLDKKVVKTDAKTTGKKTSKSARSGAASNPSASVAGKTLASFRKAPSREKAQAALAEMDVD